MISKAQAIVQEAARLERNERVQIIEQLLETLESEPIEDPAEVSAAWRDELQRRSADLQRGQVKAISWDSVKSEADKLFDGR